MELSDIGKERKCFEDQLQGRMAIKGPGDLLFGTLTSCDIGKFATAYPLQIRNT